MIDIAPLHVRLTNCAVWHMEKLELAERRGSKAVAARHDGIAFRLFKLAREAREAACGLPTFGAPQDFLDEHCASVTEIAAEALGAA